MDYAKAVLFDWWMRVLWTLARSQGKIGYGYWYEEWTWQVWHWRIVAHHCTDQADVCNLMINSKHIWNEACQQNEMYCAAYNEKWWLSCGLRNVKNWLVRMVMQLRAWRIPLCLAKRIGQYIEQHTISSDTMRSMGWLTISSDAKYEITFFLYLHVGKWWQPLHYNHLLASWHVHNNQCPLCLGENWDEMYLKDWDDELAMGAAA